MSWFEPEPAWTIRNYILWITVIVFILNVLSQIIGPPIRVWLGLPMP